MRSKRRSFRRYKKNRQKKSKGLNSRSLGKFDKDQKLEKKDIPISNTFQKNNR